MNNEEYMHWCCNPKEAADRIERLEAALEMTNKLLDELLDALEAKDTLKGEK
jgi:hypothetical protein